VKAERTQVTFSDHRAEAVVVEPETPWRWVAWQGAQYVPMWDIDGLWVADEWFETAGTNPAGHNYEVIHDKETRFSSVDIVENGEARSVVRWNYSLCNTNYDVYHGNARAEEHYSIYPSGYAVRKIQGWPGDASDFGGTPIFWEIAELIVVNPKGTLPTQNLCDNVASYFNLEGDRYEQHWDRSKFDPPRQDPNGFVPICRVHPAASEWKETIVRIHLKDRPDPFLVIPNRQDLLPHPPCSYCGKSHPPQILWQDYPMWSHWPIYDKTDYVGMIKPQVEDAERVATHSSVTSIGVWLGGHAGEKVPYFPKPGTVWNVLFGVTDKDDDYIKTLARSWLEPMKVKATEGLSYVGYDPSQMAYVFEAAGRRCRADFAPGARSTSPCIIIRNWKGAAPRVKIAHAPTAALRVSQLDDTLVVWTGSDFEDDFSFVVD